MEDCIFCKIAQKEVPAEVILEDGDLVVFKDNKPNAPIHYLIVPKKHIVGIDDATDDLWIKIKSMMFRLKDEKRLDAFRIVCNWGNYQAVKHLHVHFTAKFKKDNY